MANQQQPQEWAPAGSRARAVFDPKTRRVTPEVMDQPGLDPRLHHGALRALERFNWLSRTGDSLFPAIERLASETPGQRLSVLDVACGGGDVALRLARRGARTGVPLEVSGCDVSPGAVAFARARRPDFEGLPPVFFEHVILHSPPPETYDIVTCTLFLHHLRGPETALLFQRLAAAARRLVLINDLLRTRTGFWMAQIASRVLTGSPVVRVDGPLSVAAALSLAEVRELADRSGWTGAVVRRIWPERFLLSWRKP